MTKPVPVADETTAFYWNATNAGRLAVQRCDACGSWRFPPAIACPVCGGDNTLVATTVSGKGTIYTFTVARQAFDRAFADDIPYVVAMVELDEDPRLRVLTNIVDVDPAAVRVGMPVEVAFERRGDAALPVFRPC